MVSFSDSTRYYLAGKTLKILRENRPPTQGLPQSSCRTKIGRNTRRQLELQILALLHRMNLQLSIICLNQSICQLVPPSLRHLHHHQETQNFYPAMIVNVQVKFFHTVPRPTHWPLVGSTRTFSLDPRIKFSPALTISATLS